MDALDALITPLRPILRPIISAAPTPLHDLALSLLGETCYTTLLTDLNFSTTANACLKLAISKALGIAIIGASAVVKIPQLLKLLSSQSAQGLSFLSYVLETASFVISLAYNARHGFPFSTYGETAFIAVQDVAIAALILVYSGRSALAGVFGAGLAAAAYALFFSGESVVDMKTLGYLQMGAGALGVASKVPQILTIWRQGGTGQLSAFAVFNYLAGSLSRIFTTLQEVDDRLILWGFISGFVLNAVLAAQMVYYWNAPATAAPTKPTASASLEKPAVGVSSGSSPRTKTASTRRRG